MIDCFYIGQSSYLGDFYMIDCFYIGQSSYLGDFNMIDCFLHWPVVIPR